VLAVVTARLGSKGVPRKNLAMLGGKPLLAWTIDAAGASTVIDRTILSTESREIAEVAVGLGCEVPFLRPPELATDDASTISVLRHAMAQIDTPFDYVVLLQPTSPLRQPDDIDGCVRRCVETGANSCVTVCDLGKPIEWCYYIGSDHVLEPVMRGVPDVHRRQHARPAYTLNGAVYAMRWAWLVGSESLVDADSVAHVMPRTRSLDIDTQLDFSIAEALVAESAALLRAAD